MNCRGCGQETQPVIDLGEQYLPDFPEPGTPPGERYPLQVMVCTG